jgi:hypothetical protein
MPSGQPDPAGYRGGRHRIGRCDRGAQRKADGQRHRRHGRVQDHAHQPGHEDDVPYRQKQDWAQVEPERRYRYLQRRHVEQRRQDRGHHQTRVQLRHREARHEGESQPHDDQQDWGEQAEAAGRRRDCDDDREEQDRLDQVHSRSLGGAVRPRTAVTQRRSD